jgi:predicted phosphohydrolase
MSKLLASKYIRIYSDMHLDCDIKKHFKFDMLWMPEELSTDKDTILILPGDIWHADKMFLYENESWLKALSKKFQYILVVLGNHDLWGGNFSHEYKNVNNKITEQNLENVFLLQNTTIEIGDYKFIGATLWTDFLQGDKFCLYEARNLMKDYKKIRHGNNYAKLTPQIIYAEHMKSKDFIFKNAIRDFPEQKIWVISHHSPSYQSIADEYKIPSLKLESALYYSDLDEVIGNSEIDYWVHGHTHKKVEYWINKTKVLSNPRGYPSEDTFYDKTHLIKLN